jgi:hypothetical protein
MLVAHHLWVIGAVSERLRESRRGRFTAVPFSGAKTVALAYNERRRWTVETATGRGGAGRASARTRRELVGERLETGAHEREDRIDRGSDLLVGRGSPRPALVILLEQLERRGE